jgi:phospholipid transport system substrate-binding protein
MMNIETSRRRLCGLGVAALAAALVGARPAVAADPAVASIERWYARLVSTMQEASSLSVQARYQRLAPVLAEAFDFADMTRLSVGPAFNQASGAQQAAIRQAFQKFIGAFYANRIDGYSSEKFQVDPVVENRGGQRVVKTTLVRPGGGSTRIDYLMNGSRVIDIYLDGSISEVASRRGEFSSIIASGGPDALVKALRDKYDQLMAG